MSDTPWIPYAEQRPLEAGVYLWRVPSLACPDLKVTLQARMRLRSAGYREELSPSFDYWDGVRLLVPNGTEWCQCANPADLAPYERTQAVPEGVELLPCPFCGEIPRFQSAETSPMGGVAIFAAPQLLNCWWLKCCPWVKTPRFHDPRVLANDWNAMLSRPR